MNRTKLDNLFSEFNNNTPGCAIIVVQNGNVLLEACYGLADLQNTIPITPATTFRLASLTKPFTAMAIMILYEDKFLTYEDTLNMFFPDFPKYGANITIRQLLTHTSGIPDHEKPLYKSIKPGEEPTIYESLEILKQQRKLLFKSDSQYLYSDAGYVLLALIIEKVSRRKYADFLKENIFLPLQMNNTLVVDETKPYIKNRAYGYKKINEAYQIYDYNPLNYIIGDEGIYSTIRDLALWRKAWYTETLVSKHSLEWALSQYTLSTNEITPCGYSWFIEIRDNQKIIYHDGFWVGFNNIMLTDCNLERTVVMLSNTTNFSSTEKKVNVAMKILDAIT